MNHSADRPLFYDTNRMRFELLRALYAHARRHPNQAFSEAELEEEFGVSPIQFDWVVQWLVANGYVEVAPQTGVLTITERGSAEMMARGLHWRQSMDEILDWLDAEKARIATTHGPIQASAHRSPETVRRTREAIREARRRRIALLGDIRDMSRTFAH